MWWGIPGWALGVGIIIIASTLSKAFVPLLRAHANRVEREGSSWRRHGALERAAR